MITITCKGPVTITGTGMMPEGISIVADNFIVEDPIQFTEKSTFIMNSKEGTTEL
jgi:hypothetical protein